MKKTNQLLSDSRTLTARLIDRGLTATDAARAAGISPDTFYPLIRHDRKISLKTASKLRSAFGADTVKFTEPAQILKGCDSDDLYR